MERTLVKLMAVWQVVIGILTIFVYAPLYKKGGQGMDEVSVAYGRAMRSVFNSMWLFIISFGMLSIVSGLILWFVSREIKDEAILTKVPTYVLVVSVVAYLMMDVVSGTIGITAVFFMLSKNKAIKMVRETGGVS